MSSPPQHMSRTGAGERGFTIIEVLVAALLLIIVSVGVAAMATTSTSSQNVSKLRQRQAAVAEGALAKVKSNVYWAKTKACDSPTALCNISYLFSGDKDLTDATTDLNFKVSARAQAVDSTLDLTGTSDTDGQSPDFYRVSVTVTPDAATAANYPNVQPLTLTAEINQTTRPTYGRLTVTGCYVTDQADERMPMANCTPGTKQYQELVPPIGLSWLWDGPHVADCGKNAAGRDCTSYMCAHPFWAGYGSCPTSASKPSVTKVGLTITPSAFWKFKLRGPIGLPQDATTVHTLNAQGVRTISGLTPGEYRVTFYGYPSNFTTWFTHSVPADGYATVESGLISRAVTMFRPDPRTAGWTADLQTIDVSDPYNNVTHPDIYPSGRCVTFRMVPSPAGRVPVQKAASACAPSNTIDWNSVEPGLYESYVADSSAKSFTSVTNTWGYIWLPRLSGTQTQPTSAGPYGSRGMITLYHCDDTIRSALKITNAFGSFYSSFGPGVDTNADGIADYFGMSWSDCGSGGGGGGGGPGAGGGGGA